MTGGNASSLAGLAADRRLVVCVGPGGVGKTTVAAAIALDAARRGRKTLVMTIDPAKRLADALGVTGLGDEIRPVDPKPLEAAGVSVEAPLHACMFDNASSMDSLMSRLAPDEETREGILTNRVYRAMAGSLARSHAYLAMERLHEVMTGGEYDLVVLDTPPARNALDILDAPGRLASFLDEGVIKWFVGTKPKGFRERVLATGGAAVTRLFGLVVGREFLDETIGFFSAFHALREGFRERAEVVQSILRDGSTAFCLVSSVDVTHLEDARALAQSVHERDVSLDAVVFNRSYELLRRDSIELLTEAAAAEAADTDARIWERLDGSEPELAALRAAIAAAKERAVSLNREAVQAVSVLDPDLDAACLRVMIARLDGDVRDLPGLHALSEYLHAAARRGG